MKADSERSIMSQSQQIETESEQLERSMVNVLFVDDEPFIIFALKRGLQDEPYHQHFAQSAQEALDIMRTTPIHILVTDLKMPIMGGLELLKEVEHYYPHVIKLVLSGYAQLPQLLETVNQVNVFRFISKPFNLDRDMKHVLLSAIEYYEQRILDGAIASELRQYDPLEEIHNKRESYFWSERKNDISKIASLFGRMTAIERLRFEKAANEIETIRALTIEMEYMHHLLEGYLGMLPDAPRVVNFDEFIQQMSRRLKDSSEVFKKITGESLKIDLKSDSIDSREDSGMLIDVDLLAYLIITLVREYFAHLHFHEITIEFKGNHAHWLEIYVKLNEPLETQQLIFNLLRLESLSSFFMMLFESFQGEAVFTNDERQTIIFRLPKHLEEDSVC